MAANAVFIRDAEPERRLGLEDVELGKDEEVAGAVRFAVKDSDSQMTIRLVESSGKSREIELSGIGF